MTMERVFRLHRGEDLLQGIRQAASDMDAAYVACCVGCVSAARIRDASGVTVRELHEDMEIVSLTGTVSAKRCHLHIALSKEDLSTIGGHLMEGCIVNTTAEIVLRELDGVRFDTAFDPQTGYDELVIQSRSQG